MISTTYNFIKYAQVKHKLALYERIFVKLDDISVDSKMLSAFVPVKSALSSPVRHALVYNWDTMSHHNNGSNDDRITEFRRQSACGSP